MEMQLVAGREHLAFVGEGIPACKDLVELGFVLSSVGHLPDLLSAHDVLRVDAIFLGIFPVKTPEAPLAILRVEHRSGSEGAHLG